MHSFEEDALRAAPTAAESAAVTSEKVQAPPEARTVAGVMNLQRTAGNASVAQLLHGDEDRQSITRATSGGGSPLDNATRVQMEQAFGTDFSSVRVHTGSEADASARQLGAHAYTVGEDVVFANGRFDAGSPTGQRTLAHELTHVVQQRSGPVEGTDTGGGVKVSHPSDRYEQAAESMAEQVTAGRLADTATPTSSAATAPAVQREGEEEEVQTLAVQREGEDEEEVQTLAVQREGEEEDEVQTLAVQREGEEEEDHAEG